MMTAREASLTLDLKQYARDELGFHLVGITSAEPFERAELDVLRWLADGHNGEMAWLNEARARLACRPAELLAGAQSLVVVGVSYRGQEPPAPGIARYAQGSDYHDAMKARLRLLAAWLTEHWPGAKTRIFVDDAPLVERDAAIRAGLGFRGKNTNLLTPIGSFVFLGALLTDVPLEIDQPLAKDCGTCRLCLDACPTGALDGPYHLAAERCIAYLTIEHRGPIAPELRPRMGEWVFGCDVCQDVCPYNASARLRPQPWPEFSPRPRLSAAQMLALDEDGFRATFKGSPVKRAKRRGLARNAAIALGNAGAGREALDRAAQADPEPLVREAADWARRRVAAAQQVVGDDGA
jgi:epoxyqueuosine reductase